MFRLFLVFFALLAAPALAATSAVALTPRSVAVLGGETRAFSARFLDAAGRPAAGEPVLFVNDACGTFGNGAAVTTVTTDGNGVASAAFTARAQGITCWVQASAPGSATAAVRWDVLTFTLAQLHFVTTLAPPQPRPGQAFTITATPMAGAYRLYETEISARVVAGTASASIAPAGGSTGQSGSVAFEVLPDHRVGDYEIEIQYRHRAHRVAIKAPDAPWQDLWWGGVAENGWGVSVVQHRDTLFSVIYAYDADGAPTWYVMPGGSWDDSRTRFSGPLYSPRGSPFHAYRAADLSVGGAVGFATLQVMDGNHIALEYSIAGASGRKTLTRQDFGPVDAPLAANLADMWWGGIGQNGWGIAVLQQYRTLFAIWFTYDDRGAPTWFVMPSGSWSGAATYEGRLYRASGATWLGRPYDAAAFRAVEAGTFRLRFAGEGARFDYTIDARSGTMELSRQPF